MHVILYKNTAPPNKVDKTSNLSSGYEIEGVKFVEKNTLDILRPSVLLHISDEVSDIAKYNYMYIAKFKRYYFIDSVSTEGGLFRVDGRCDALMSHKDDIYASKQYILRQETYNNSPYLDDNMLPIRSDHAYVAKPFGSNVDDRSCGRIIMATTGKGGRVI